MDILINQHESRFRIVFMNNLFGKNIKKNQLFLARFTISLTFLIHFESRYMQ